MLMTRRAVKGLKLIFKYSFFTGEDEAFQVYCDMENGGEIPLF